MFSFEHPRRGETRLPRMFWNKLQLFRRRPDVLSAGAYKITSDVDREVVDLFFARVMGDNTVVVTAENAERLRALCDKLGFSGFDDEIREVLDGDSGVRRDLVCLRGRVDRHDVILEELQRRVLELERQLRERRAVPERGEAVERTRRSDEGARKEAGALRESIQRQESAADARARAREEVARLKKEEAKPTKQAKERNPPAVTGNSGKRQAPAEIQIVYDKAKPLEGIIAHLTRQCGGNVHDKGVVEATASSIWSGLKDAAVYSSCEAKHATELGTNVFFQSDPWPDSWICYDFKGQRVAPTSYSIRSDDGHFPKSWVFEVSNNGKEWKVIDRRDNNSDLKAVYVTRNFAISGRPSEAFRFVRLRQTGKNHSGRYDLVLTSIEVFGTLSS